VKSRKKLLAAQVDSPAAQLVVAATGAYRSGKAQYKVAKQHLRATKKALKLARKALKRSLRPTKKTGKAVGPKGNHGATKAKK